MPIYAKKIEADNSNETDKCKNIDTNHEAGSWRFNRVSVEMKKIKEKEE